MKIHFFPTEERRSNCNEKNNVSYFATFSLFFDLNMLSQLCLVEATGSTVRFQKLSFSGNIKIEMLL